MQRTSRRSIPELQNRPGALLKSLRSELGWTLREVGRRTGYAVSTISKIERNRISLGYDKLVRLAACFEIDPWRLFVARNCLDTEPVQGRLSVSRGVGARPIRSKSGLPLYPAADLLHKDFTPSIIELRARSLEQFGGLVRYPGEEYLYVLEGKVEVHTSAYAPVRLSRGDSIYLDSTMGHAYLATGDQTCRALMAVSGTPLSRSRDN